MFESKTYNLTAGTATAVVTCENPKGINILSLMVNGGEAGGVVTLNFGEIYSMTFKITPENTVVFDHKMCLSYGETLTATSDTDGVKIIASVMDM